MQADAVDAALAPAAGLVAPPAPPLPRWRCTVAYDGTRYTGWQSQPGGRAIQDVIEQRLATIFGREVRIHGSGRTDAGVHALGQVFHCDAAWAHGPAKFAAALRAGLPADIGIPRAAAAPATFHARYSATGKIYHYDLVLGRAAGPFEHRVTWALPRVPDLAAMEAAAAVLRGRHDFRAFSAFGGVERLNTVRDLRRLELQRRGARLRIVAEADGFLYKMVRSLVGALVAAGQGKLTPDELRTLLADRTRTARVETAPPQGLFLVRVIYGRGPHLESRPATGSRTGPGDISNDATPDDALE